MLFRKCMRHHHLQPSCCTTIARAHPSCCGQSRTSQKPIADSSATGTIVRPPRGRKMAEEVGTVVRTTYAAWLPPTSSPPTSPHHEPRPSLHAVEGSIPTSNHHKQDDLVPTIAHRCFGSLGPQCRGLDRRRADCLCVARPRLPLSNGCPKDLEDRAIVAHRGRAVSHIIVGVSGKCRAAWCNSVGVWLLQWKHMRLEV